MRNYEEAKLVWRRKWPRETEYVQVGEDAITDFVLHTPDADKALLLHVARWAAAAWWIKQKRRERLAPPVRPEAYTDPAFAFVDWADYLEHAPPKVAAWCQVGANLPDGNARRAVIQLIRRYLDNPKYFKYAAPTPKEFKR